MNIKNLFNNLPLQQKLLVAFIGTVSAPVIIALIFSLYFFFDSFYTNAKNNIKDKLRTAKLIFDKKQEEIEDIALSGAGNNLVILNLELSLTEPLHDFCKFTISSKNVSFYSIFNTKHELLISGNKKYFYLKNKNFFSSGMFEKADENGAVTFVTPINSKDFLELEEIGSDYPLAIVSIVPINNYAKELIGYIVAGYVISDVKSSERNLSLIDEIKVNVEFPVLFLHETTPLGYTEGTMTETTFNIPDEVGKEITKEDKFEFFRFTINNKPFLYSMIPIKSEAGIEYAKIGIGFPEAEYQEIGNRIILLFLIIAVISFLLAGIIAYYLSRNFTKPIITMVEGTKLIRQGNFEQEVPVKSNDEIGTLGKAFNEMVLKLRETLYELKSEIDERKKTAEELQKTKNYLRNVFNSLSSILISVDRAGRVTEWNTAASIHRGISAKEAISKKVWDVIPLLKQYETSIQKVINSRKPVEFYRESTETRTEKKYMNISIYPLIYHDIEGAVIRLDDVSELERKDEQLRQAQKMETVGTLAGGLAHDFNNVLAGIIGSVTLIRFYSDDPEPIEKKILDENIEIIDRSATRARDMVTQLLTLSRRQEISFAAVDLNLSVKHVLKICEPTFDKSVELNYNFYKKPAMVKADPTQLEQVILNLCINAAHAMTIMRESHEKQGGELILDIELIHSGKHFILSHPEAEITDYFVLRVHDTGVGMTPETAAKIFDPFFTTKEKGKGTGLGLAMVYNIIQQHHGFVDVYSELGVGSTINVFLPVLRRDDGFNPEEEISRTIERGTGTILIVDDEEIVRHMASNILIECGYKIITATNGLEGVEVYKERMDEIDAVLLDMAMPKLSGKEAFAKMKKINPRIKALLASGYKQDSRVQDSLAMGVKDFIQKPYTLVELSQKMKKVVED